MWSKTCSIRVKGVTADKIWQVWTDVNNWHEWQDDIEYAKLDGSLAPGGTIRFKPKDGQEIRLQITEAEGFRFVDIASFPLARMHDCHELAVYGDTVEIMSTISASGPLAFVWRKLVMEGVAAGLEEQTMKLIKRIEHDGQNAIQICTGK